MKNPDWNSVLKSISAEDWSTAMSSEIFRNFMRMESVKLAEEECQQEKRLENEKALIKEFKKQFEDIMKEVEKQEKLSDVPKAIIPNLPYGADHQEKIVEHLKEKKAEEVSSAPASTTPAPAAPVAPEPANKQPETQVATPEKVQPVQQNKLPEPAKVPEVAQPPYQKLDTSKPQKEIKLPENDLYHTNAGESKHIDIGLMPDTIKDFEKDRKLNDATKEVMKVYKDQEEIKEAEEALGLSTNVAYIISNWLK
jgi:hypothetical protein